MRLIDGDEAIERFTQIRPVNPKQSDYTHGIDVGLALAKAAIRDQKTIEPQCKTDEWCSDCKEYDQERHCCPRWNRVIRQALKDAQPEHKYHDPFGNPIYVYVRVGDKTVSIKADDLQKALDYVTEHGEEVTIEGEGKAMVEELFDVPDAEGRTDGNQ